MADQTMTYGIAANLNANTFKRTGFVFSGWNTQANGSGTSYTNKQSVNNLTSTAGGIVTLYAQWRKVDFEVRDYTIDGNLITDILENTKTEDYVQHFDIGSNYKIEVYDKTGTNKLSNTDIIGTGSILRVYKNNVLEAEYVNIVPGDVTGEGKVNSTDVSIIAHYIIGTEGYNLTDIEIVAADITKEGNVNSTDVSIIAHYIIGTEGYNKLVK